MQPRVLVAGVGNIFLGDDAFGVEVVQKLLQRATPHGARVVDFGIRGLDLTYALLDGYDAVVVVDAMPRGGVPGTLYVLEPDRGEIAGEGVPLIEGHGLDPVKVLRLAATMGARIEKLLVVGCEPSPADPNNFQDGLSEPVRAAVAEAVPLIERLVAQLLAGAAALGPSELLKP